jgi:hypothetical protein
MINSLYKVIRKVIVPQYPWIKDFVWTSTFYAGFEYYSLELTVDNDFYYGQLADTQLTHKKLYDDVNMLFRLVGPDDGVFFDDITFSPEKDDDD